MSNRGEMWVHGCSAMIQYPGGEGLSPYTSDHRMANANDPAQPDRRVHWSDLLGVRSGYGATFCGVSGTTSRPNTNWFQFSIPTPSMVPGPGDPNIEITVDRVSVYYITPGDQITIQTIGVSDGLSGTQGIQRVADSHLYGDHSGPFEETLNSWLINPIHLRQLEPHGVLISVEVRFDIEGEITFTAAGIHYSVG